MRTNVYARGPRRDGVQAALGRGAGDPAARADVRDLRLRARHGGHPPARRAHRARRDPLVGPHGLPHRGLRAHARADDQERGHRSGGREGRVLPQGARPSDPAALKRRGRAPVRRATSRRCWTSPTTSSTATCVHPEGVVVRDEDDTYLVVAADKGTATFSDTANEIAVRRGFWLGDAFASGGSAGYDHKALGITAKGAWESVKRHFRELGIDPESDVDHRGRDRRHVGRRLRQRDAAEPDAEARRGLRPPARLHRPRSGPGAVVEERKRLFDLAGSSWDDYDKELISPGGGVYPRRPSGSSSPSRRARRSGSSRRGAVAGRGDPGDPARPRGPAVERRHRHGGQGVDGDRRRRAGPFVGLDPRGRRPAALPRDRRGRQPRPDAARAHRVRRSAAGASTRTSSTTRPGWTAPTTRST